MKSAYSLALLVTAGTLFTTSTPMRADDTDDRGSTAN